MTPASHKVVSLVDPEHAVGIGAQNRHLWASFKVPVLKQFTRIKIRLQTISTCGKKINNVDCLNNC